MKIYTLSVRWSIYSVVRATTFVAATSGLLVAAGCQFSPRTQVEAGAAIRDAVGLSTPVEFIAVGPDGGPLDEPGGVDSLSLSEAIRQAVTTDPGLQAAFARIRMAMAEADQARLLPNPVLGVVLRWGPGKPQIEASLAQEFVQAIQLPKRASAADNRLRQAAAQAVTVAIDLVAEVQDRYVSAQAAAAMIPLFKDRISLLEKIIATAQARFDLGEGQQGDLATLRAQRVELQVEVDQALLAEREERLRLARLIGQPSNEAVWTLDAWAPPSADLAGEARWVEQALSSRPEIQAIAWKLRALGDEEALVKFFPWQGASAGVDVQRDGNWFAGPSVSTPLPIFDTGEARRDRITAEQLEARHELTLARRKVVEEVRVAYQTMAASTANLSRVRGELLPLQEQRRSLAETSFRSGLTDSTKLYLAEQDLRETQTRAFAIERQAAIALVRLQRAVGGPGVAAAMTSVNAGDATRTGSGPVPSR